MYLKVVTLLFATGLLFALDNPPKPSAKGGAIPGAGPTSPANSRFDTIVKPTFAANCLPCHNDRLPSGSLNLAQYATAASVLDQRDQWERIVHKIRTGEMPPKGFPKPPQEQLDA